MTVDADRRAHRSGFDLWDVRRCRPTVPLQDVFVLRLTDNDASESFVECSGAGVVLLDTDAQRDAGVAGFTLEVSDNCAADSVSLDSGEQLDPGQFDQSTVVAR